jgi:hypothetical protein
MTNNWQGLMKVVEVAHLDRNGKTLWQQNNIRNVLHAEGEAFILSAVFTGGTNNTFIPEYYYLGMDNRTTVYAAQTMSDIYYEPSSYGYQRQDISSTDSFNITLEDDHWTASSEIKVFMAVGGTWEATNVFLTDRDDGDGYLISSAQFESPITVEDGESITMRIALMLRDCPV